MYAGLGQITHTFDAPRRLTPEEDAAARGERVAVIAARVAAGELDPTAAPYAGQPAPGASFPPQVYQPVQTAGGLELGKFLPVVAAAALAYFVI